MRNGGTGSETRRWCFALLVFLLVYLPLDAFDADASDTFDGSLVQVQVQADDDTVHSVPHPVVTTPEAPRAASGLRAVAQLSEPICTILVTRKPFGLPRSDDPHVASPLPSGLPGLY